MSGGVLVIVAWVLCLAPVVTWLIIEHRATRRYRERLAAADRRYLEAMEDQGPQAYRNALRDVRERR